MEVQDISYSGVYFLYRSFCLLVIKLTCFTVDDNSWLQSRNFKQVLNQGCELSGRVLQVTWPQLALTVDRRDVLDSGVFAFNLTTNSGGLGDILNFPRPITDG